ncbi:MAG: cyclase family protein [Bdellovibrionales bacterium]
MKKNQFIDISPLISEKIAVWPGDTPFTRNISLDMEQGANIGLSSIHTTVHLGAHADARSHYLRSGPSIDRMELEPYYGHCQVLEVNIPRGKRIQVQDLKESITSQRILLKTNSFPDPNHFNEDFNSLSPELIEFLSEKNVLLIGIDTPSIDPFADKILESHQAISKNQIVNLEGLVLAHVQPGNYTLIAMPLKIASADASPVRAVLVTT